ncbi:alpha/beta hydrolase family protein [Effusibacillus consociatus]|uniref:Alpha/beta hydrolase family protein n=1 Tax=Effusibacillus consociatus TaxID=1117041 RepID=A0ABV9QAL9_9BACL
MDKYTAKLIDQMGLFLLHLKKSRTSQFYEGGEKQVWVDIERTEDFYSFPRLPDVTLQLDSQNLEYRVGRYFFESEIKSEDPSNNIASGSYYMKETEEEPVHVIFVHGWRMDNLDRIKNIFLKRFMKLGNNMYFVHLPYHFERTSGGLYSGEYMISANVGRSVASVRQAVIEIRALIKWLKKNYGGKVILIGVSLGGLIANLSAAVEEEIDVLVSVMYANSLSYEVWKTPIGKYTKKDFEQHGFTYEQLKKCWSVLEPSCWQPKVKKENILLISGIHDQYIRKEDSEALWTAWNHPKRFLYPVDIRGLCCIEGKLRKMSHGL